MKLLLPGLVMLVGCGSQDRYEVMSPEVSFVIEDESWGLATVLPTVHNSFNPSPAAVVDGRLYFGSRSGMVYEVTPTGYETLPRPGDLYVWSLLAGPEGLLWRADYTGNILFFQDGQWELDIDLDLDWDSGTRMMLDNQNRILFIGGKRFDSGSNVKRRLWRRDHSGQWSLQDLPGEPAIVFGWCEHGKPPVFLTGQLQMVTEGLDGWQVSEPLLEEIDNEAVEFQGSQDGRMAVRIGTENYFLLNEGDGWQIKNTGTRLRHLFWLKNELYAIDRFEETLVHWDGQDWVVIQTIEDYWGSKVRSQAHGSERILFFPEGESRVFNGLELISNTLPLGSLLAFVPHEGLNHLYMGGGMHLQGTDGIWEEVGRPFQDQDRSSVRGKMLIDDQDHLVFFGSNKIMHWDGHSYHEYDCGEYLRGTFLQDDGKVVVFSENQAGVWSQGQLHWVGNLDDSSYYKVGAKWESAEKIQVLYQNHLRLVEPEQSTITMTFQGWTPYVSAAGPGQSLACGGRERMVVIDGTTVLDITPIWGDVNGQLGRISAIISDGLGGWLAYDYDRSSLLKFDGRKWYDLGESFDGFIFRESGTLASNRDGTFILQDSGNVFLIEPGAGP